MKPHIQVLDLGFIFVFFFPIFLERISCIIVAGGHSASKGVNPVEVIGYFRGKKFPNLPLSKKIGSSLVLHNRTILSCGGVSHHRKICLKLDQGTWNYHSTFNTDRTSGHSVVSTKNALFIFGGLCSSFSYEYLPKNATTWQIGETEIPGGFIYGFAIAVKSEQEIWLIGGWATGTRILSFNVNDHTFQELPFQLNTQRRDHKAAIIPNTNKIMVTGGWNLNSVEIIDTEDAKITLASPMNYKRSEHGMGIVTIEGEDRLAVFGGQNKELGHYDDLHYGDAYLDTIELYNTETGLWEISNKKLKKGRYHFAYLCLKLSDVYSKL